MTGLQIEEHATYEAFASDWQASNTDTRLLWQLLGQLEDTELLVEIPEWLAEEKVGFVDGATPTLFIGHIERETENAILFADSAAARPLMKLAHRIHELEQNESDPDRNEWLDRRLEAHRTEFTNREDVPGLSDGWLPKSQLVHAVRQQK